MDVVSHKGRLTIANDSRGRFLTFLTKHNQTAFPQVSHPCPSSSSVLRHVFCRTAVSFLLQLLKASHYSSSKSNFLANPVPFIPLTICIYLRIRACVPGAVGAGRIRVIAGTVCH